MTNNNEELLAAAGTKTAEETPETSMSASAEKSSASPSTFNVREGKEERLYSAEEDLKAELAAIRKAWAITVAVALAAAAGVAAAIVVF